MAHPSFMFIVLTALLIGTAIAQPPKKPPPKTRAPLAPAPSSGGDLAPSQSAFAPAPSPSHGGPRHFPAGPVASPPPHAASPAPGRGAHAPRPSIAATPIVSRVGTPAPAPMSGAVSNRLALGTLAVGLLVVSLVA